MKYIVVVWDTYDQSVNGTLEKNRNTRSVKYMCLNKLFEKKYGISKPNITGTLDINEVTTLLKANFPNATIYVSDSEYNVAPFSEYQRFVIWDNTDKEKYIAQSYDCDDFSFRIMGEITIPGWSSLPFGIIWTDTKNGGHAINFFIDNKMDCWIIEPQSDDIFILPKDWTPYLVII